MASELETRIVELQLLKEQLEQYEKQAIMLMENAGELQVTMSAIENLKKAEKSSDILVPLGGGLYGKAALGDIKSLLVGVGGGVFIDKPAKEAEAFLDGKLKRVEETSGHITVQMQLIANAIERLNAEVQKLAEKK